MQGWGCDSLGRSLFSGCSLGSVVWGQNLSTCLRTSAQGMVRHARPVLEAVGHADHAQMQQQGTQGLLACRQGLAHGHRVRPCPA